MKSPITVDCNFAGGNIVLDRIVEHGEGDVEIYVHQDLRDTEGDWFYWYFRVSHAAGRNLRVTFTGSDIIGTRGPGVSVDGGCTWAWLGRDCVTGPMFTYRVPAGQDEVRFSLGMPYLQANLDAFLATLPAGSPLERSVLCRSRGGRDVERLRAGRLDGKAQYCLLLTARHHCCEMMASYALEGILHSMLAQDEIGAWLRENVEILAVPFVDKDGVEAGDQGKNRRPHDHNRDYGQESIYPEVRTLREQIQPWSAGRPLLVLDLHCPWIRGEYNEWVYFVGTQDQQNWAKVTALGDILEAEQRAGLAYCSENNLAFGVAWNVSTGGLKSNTTWALEQPNLVLGASMEIPYASANGAVVDQNSARAFGHDLARALQIYLSSQQNKEATNYDS